MRGRFGYHKSLDGLRALSILPVFAFHLGMRHTIAGFRLVQGGFIGVDVFFVISGFLITTILLGEWHQLGDISLRRFYVRRALRLFPALFLMVACIAITRLWRSDHLLPSRASIQACLFYYANWFIIKNGSTSMGLLNHTWSLSIEEQFYLLWPPLLFWLLRTGLKPKWLIGLLVTGAAMSATARTWLTLHHARSDRLYFGLDVRADSLLIGCLAAAVLYYTHSNPRLSVVRTVAAWAGALTLTSLVFTLSYFSPRVPYLESAIALSAGAIIWHIVAAPEGKAARLLATVPLVWIGKLSYSIYLWHFPVCMFPLNLTGVTSLAVKAGGSVVLAIASHYVVERPFLRWKDRWITVPRAATAAAAS